MVACDSWLDTTPPSQVPEEDQFDDEFGFRQALIGCYIGMADVDLYGKQLTWYSVEMQSGQYSMTQITEMVGFSNPSRFASAFRKRFGCNPGEYNSVKH